MKQCILLLSAISVLFADIFQQNARLSRTLNLGNYFEAPRNAPWNSPLERKDLETIAEKGFTAVRLPVRWSNYLDADLKLDQTFLAKIGSVIDDANALGLTVVMDDHHFDSLFANLITNRPASLAIWSQLSAYFAKYPDSLLFFEPLNEPHGQITSELWNQLFAEQLAVIRKLNPSRPVVMGTTEWGGISGLYSLRVPSDPNIIVTVHYYSPFQFTHQGADWVDGADGWLGTKWQGTAAEKKAITADIDAVSEWAEANNRPVFFGEFGSYEKAALEDRLRWTHFMGRVLESRKLSWAYWEYSSGFGLYDKKLAQWKPLADTLLSKDTSTLIIDETSLILGDELIKNGNFTEGKTGWTFGAWNQDAKASADFTKGTCDISISAVTSLAYNIQLLQNGLTLKGGKEYRFQLRMSSADSFSLSSGLMRSDYSTAASGSFKRISKKSALYETVFTTAADETNLTLALSLGYHIGSVSIDSVSLKEVLSTSSTPSASLKPASVTFQKDRILFSRPVPANSKVSIYSARGQEICSAAVNGQTAVIPELAPGWYAVAVRNSSNLLFTASFIQHRFGSAE